MSGAAGRPLLDVANVRRSFGGVKAVADCSLHVKEGEVCGLIGPNGAGKSTVVGLVGGSLRPDAGEVWFLGENVTRWPPHRRARRGLLRTFQLSEEWPRLSVIENLLVAAPDQIGESLWPALVRRKGMLVQERSNWTRAETLLNAFGLANLRDDAAGTLSGGQKRLLELARIAMGRARLALLDEPMAGISPAMRTAVMAQVKSMQRTGMAFLVVEHDLAVVAELCSRVVVMAAGRVLTEGTLDEVRSHPDVVGAYLGASQ